MKPSIRNGYTLEVLFIAGIVAISFSAIFIKWSQAEVSVIAMYRLYLANLMLLPFIWKYKQEIARLTLRQWGLLVVAGAALGLHFLLWMGSLRFTTVASSTVILTLQPIVVMLGSFYFFRLHANRAMIIGMGIALAGSFAIGIGDLRLSGAALYGDMLSFLSVIAISMHMLLGKQLREHISAYVYNFWVFAFAASLIALYNVFNDFSFGGYAQSEWGLFILLALIPTLFGHYLFNWLLKYMNASAVSMAILGEPVVASVLAWLLLNEKLTLFQLGAGLFILLGVWIFVRYGKETNRE
ncbi:DMT family transporter [Paenibacillus sp. FSL H7-0331]|uniref:DMT family transporter n=1 Tax=Paenibacillus sp. FSL H7-0331 TaxID=1920421 RepID=UPI00096C1D51|nr:DMT family transporter [Paenibacillus sp. FSL H7-0331]OMF10799.1 EamA family transporter [Paenibacillus sp. FSL H7-0331]